MTTTDAGDAHEPRRSRLPTALAPRRWRVGTKIAVSLVLVALVPVLILAQLGSQRLRERAEADGRRELQAVAEAVATGLDTEVRANVELISAVALDPSVIELASDPATRGETEGPVHEQLDILRETHPTSGIFFIVDAAGVAIASSDRAILGISYDYRPYYELGMQGVSNVTDVYLPIGTTSDVPGTAFAAPIRRDGTVVGVAVIKSDALSVSKALSAAGGRQAFIVESSGIISAHPDPGLRFRSLRRLGAAEQETAARQQRFHGPVPTVPASRSVRSLVATTTPGFTTGSIDGSEVALAWRPLQETSWIVAVSEPLATYAGAADDARRDALLIAGVVALLAIVVAVVVARALSRPLHTLTAAAAGLEAGTVVDEDALAAIASRGDDLGALASRLGDAARETRQREAKLRAQVASLRVEIDEVRRRRDVEAIVESDFFADIKSRAADLRRHVRGDDAPAVADDESDRSA